MLNYPGVNWKCNLNLDLLMVSSKYHGDVHLSQDHHSHGDEPTQKTGNTERVAARAPSRKGPGAIHGPTKTAGDVLLTNFGVRHTFHHVSTCSHVGSLVGTLPSLCHQQHLVGTLD